MHSHVQRGNEGKPIVMDIADSIDEVPTGFDKETGSFKMTPTDHESVNIDHGGGTTYSDKDGPAALVIISDSSRPMETNIGGKAKVGPAGKLMHELVGHAMPNLLGGGTGNAIDNENMVRGEMSLPLRMPDSKHTE